jgi:predicted flap endonuclease-1-like 5' DNA nuclease
LTAPAILRQWREDAFGRIEANVKALSESHPDLAEGTEALVSARGRDAAHTETYRLMATADLVEAVTAKLTGASADPLDEKSKAELQRQAELEGAEVKKSATKEETKEAIREERAEDEPEDVESLDEIGPELAATLKESGITTLDDLRGASDNDLLKLAGIGKVTLKRIRQQL